jgi:site-specific recombinase XerD
MTNLTAQFKAYLLQKDLSSVSVKNYVSDINKFLNWCDIGHPRGGSLLKTGGTSGVNSIPNQEDFESYYNKITQNNTPGRDVACNVSTTKRYLSSLKKFGQFLQDEYLLAKNPAIILEARKNSDMSAKAINLEKMLDAYRKSLEKDNAKPATIKNYLADTRQFLDWLVSQ